MIYLGPLGPGPVFMRFRPRISADMNIYIVVYQYVLDL